MASSKVLHAPVLPQMGDDGVITAIELESGTVDVLVPRYSNIQVGDAIRVFFGTSLSSYRTVTQSDKEQPTMLFQYPETAVPDNVYNVYYQATDWAGNVSISPTVTAVVSRDGNNILIPPVFTDAVNNVITIENVVTSNGTHVHVPPYQGIRAGDTVTLSSSVFTAAGEPISEGTHAVTHVVTSDEWANGFTVLVPPSKVFLPQSANIRASYRVTRAITGEMDSSSTAEASLSGVAVFLPAPWFPDSVLGWLSYEQVSAGILTHVEVPTFAQINDIVTLSWGGYDKDNIYLENASGQLTHVVTAADILANVIEFIIPRNVAVNIWLGHIEAYYRVLQQGTTYFSYNGFANIDMVHSIALPAPVFTQSLDGFVEMADIESDNGVSLAVMYPGMKLDDLVTVVVSGFYPDGESVAAADYQQSYSITSEEVQNNRLSILIPATIAYAVGEHGTLAARYYVLYANENGFSYSLEESIMLSNSKENNDKITLFSTTGAPVFNYESVRVRPYNMGFVKAPPGSSIAAYCSSPAVFMESESTEYKFIVGLSGTTSFHIKSPQTGLINLALVDNDNQMPQVNGITAFSSYQIGNGKIKAFAYTSGARADGISPCSVYVIVEKESDSEIDTNTPNSLRDNYQQDDSPYRPITMLRATVTGSATIQGYGAQSADIFLNSDNSVEIGVVNNVAESVSVILTLPESAGSVQMLTLNFRDF